MKISKTVRVIARVTQFQVTSNQPKKKPVVSKMHFKNGVYRTTINRGHIIITTFRKYVDTDKQATKFIEQRQNKFVSKVKRSRHFADLSFTSMQQRFKGKIANPYKGSVKKKGDVQKGAFGKSITGVQIINRKSKRDLDVMLHNRLIDLENDAIRVSEQTTFSKVSVTPKPGKGKKKNAKRGGKYNRKRTAANAVRKQTKRKAGTKRKK